MRLAAGRIVSGKGFLSGCTLPSVVDRAQLFEVPRRLFFNLIPEGSTFVT